MIKPLSLLGMVGLMAFLTGCGSKTYPDLYKPGDIPAWRTVDTARSPLPDVDGPQVVLQTTEGPITIELYEEQAPVSTANFLGYVESDFYDGTIFHRVVPGFVVQGGGYTPDLTEKETGDPIRNEASNGLRNERGTVAMARTGEVDSARAQFFINLSDNSFLDGDGVVDGYAVFGRVVEGMGVVDEIGYSETQTVGSMDEVPVEPVVIESASITRQ